MTKKEVKNGFPCHLHSSYINSFPLSKVSARANIVIGVKFYLLTTTEEEGSWSLLDFIKTEFDKVSHRVFD
jgi:hypothetical protein